ncbi:GntR family transcriptional regulator [Pelagibacterium limicola]|uniref:GntR family transcriptional regulator n=1 Tax=Pelagibacterium limicola TaxID=2791022 RepID=UPI0018B00582|nr:GntR family transcriptional regulator [Pelagibacterium limicola]
MNANTDPYDFLERPIHMPRGSLASHVADQFRHAIVTLKLTPGTMLDKSEICARLGVSRSPVAEAMARLKSEGLIDILPQRGTVVSPVSLSAVEEYIFVRRGLECETVRALARSRPEGMVEALRANLERQQQVVEADDTVAFHPLDLEFHEILLKSTGYPRMKAMVDTARNNLDRARQLTNSKRRITEGLYQHMAITEAIEHGDGDMAARLMRKHLDDVVTEVRQLASESPHLFNGGIIVFDAIAPKLQDRPPS